MTGQFANVETELGDLKKLIFECPIEEDARSRIMESIDDEISKAPRSPCGIFARYLRARSYEEGLLANQNIDAAMEDYFFIMEHGGELRSEAMVASARLLHWRDETANTAKAVALCTEAIRLDSNVRAMMFMGFITDHTLHDSKEAARWYLEAFKNKLPWGLRFYASMQYKRKKYISAVLSHVAATIVSPVMVALYGKRDPFKL